MPTEQFTNNAQTTLNGAISDSATSLTVASHSDFPSSVNFRIKVDTELMLVTAGAGTTSWTVTRGVEGTTAVAHSDKATVTHLLTSGGLIQGILDRASGGSGYNTIQDDGTGLTQQQTLNFAGAVIKAANDGPNSRTNVNLEFAATQRLLGRNSAGAGAGEEVTLSQLLDWIGSAAQGDFLYRGASGWSRLAAGTSGQFLQTQGAGANPQWAAGAGDMELISTQTASNDTSIDFTDLSSTYAAYLVTVAHYIPATDSAGLWFRTSSNNGSSYDSGASDYKNTWGWQQTTGPSGTGWSNGKSYIEFFNNVGSAAGESASLVMWLLGHADSEYGNVSFHGGMEQSSGAMFAVQGFGWRVNKAAVDAIRFFAETGNISSGKFSLYGLKGS